jgi:hypothetical protein
VDTDGDQKPGVTLPVVAFGSLSIDAYVQLDLHLTLDATLQDPSTLAGNSTVLAKGKLVGSSFPLLTSGDLTVEQTTHPQPFTAKRFSADLSCADLLSAV